MPVPTNARALVIAAAACAAAAMFVGCGEARPQQASPGNTWRRPWSDEGIAKPAWISDPTQGGTVIAAWGSTPRDPEASAAIMRSRAVQSARNELASMIRVRIQSVLKDWMGEERTSAGGAFAQFTDVTSRSIADQSIEGSYQRADWEHPKTGEYYVWVVAEPQFAKHMAETVAAAAKTTASGDPQFDAHIRAKADSDAGFAELDRLLKDSAKP